MSVITKGRIFANGEQLTAEKLNVLVDEASFDSSTAVDNSTTRVNASGAITVKPEGITSTELATDAVTTSKIANSNVTKAKIENVANMKVLGNTSGSSAAPQEVSILDEDDMSSNSATAIATQQSIKAYVDTYKPNFALATKSDAQSITGTENTWFEITNLNPTITTKASGSTFIVTPSINWGAFNQAYGIGFKVMYSVNGGTYQDFGLPTGIGNREAVHATDHSIDDAGDMSRATFDVFFDSISYSIGDTISFKVYAQNSQVSAALYINRCESDADNNDNARSISTIKVQEFYQ